MRRLIALGLVTLLAACGDDEPKHELTAKEASKIVKQVNDATLAIQPQPILEQEIERLRFRSAGCVFSPGAGGHGAMALAMKEAAYMKVENELVRFAADSGSPEVRPGVRSRYFGTTNWFRLSFTDDKGGAHLTVGDHADHIVFDAEGKVWCDSEESAATPSPGSA